MPSRTPAPPGTDLPLYEPGRHRHRPLPDTEHGIPAPVLAAGAPARKAITMPVLTALLIGAAFVAVFLAAFHAPTSHHLPVGIAATDTVAARVELAVNDQDSQAITFRRYPDANAARAAVQRGEIPAAVVSGRPHGDLRLVVAGANGPSATGSLQATLARALGQPLPTTDVVPLAAQDSRGLSAFYASFGVVLAGYLFAVSSYQIAPRLSLGARIASMAAFALASGLTIAAIACTALGAIPAGFLTTAAVTGCLAFAMAAPAGLLLRACGPVVGIPMASIGLLILGNASSGGILPPQYLPGWLEPLSHAMPPGIAVQALRGAAYFHGAHLTTGLTLLAAWTVASLIVQYALDLAARRRTTARPATPTVYR